MTILYNHPEIIIERKSFVGIKRVNKIHHIMIPPDGYSVSDTYFCISDTFECVSELTMAKNTLYATHLGMSHFVLYLKLNEYVYMIKNADYCMMSAKKYIAFKERVAIIEQLLLLNETDPDTIFTAAVL